MTAESREMVSLNIGTGRGKLYENEKLVLNEITLDYWRKIHQTGYHQQRN